MSKCLRYFKSVFVSKTLTKVKFEWYEQVGKTSKDKNRESQEKRKDRKTRRSRSEERVVGFSSASLFLARKTGGNHPGWNHLTKGIDLLTWRRTQGAGIVKG